jgi:peptidoglycan/LPS O-acetylase OafA/YrhL
MNAPPGPSPLPRLTPRPDVQGLRALAVILVILDHAGVPWLRGGFVGVDVFFVVSGFLISSLLLHELTATGRVRIGRFYARRARRILPAATVVLVATAVFAAVRLSTTRVAEVVDDVRWSAFFAANVHFSRLGTDYFQQDRAVSPVQHFWSLAVEEQFYLCWPALLVVVGAVMVRRRLTTVTVLVGAGSVLSLTWSVLLTSHAPTQAYFSSATRAWELAVGALLALAGRLLPRLPRPLRHVLAVAGLAAVLVAALRYDTATPFPGRYALLPVLGTAALLAAGATGAVGVARLLVLPPLRYVGDISYSLYLWHWPVLVLGAAYVGTSPDTSARAALLAVIVCLSVLTYHLVENPFRRARGPLLRGRRALALWPVALAAVLLSGGWAQAHATGALQARIAGHPAGRPPPRPAAADVADVPERMSSPPVPIRRRLADALRLVDSDAAIPFPLQNLEGLDDDVWNHSFTCYAGWQDEEHEICPMGDRDATRTVVLYGNSHAGMWTPSLDRLGRRDGYRVIPLVKVGCAPFDVEQTDHGSPYPQCPAFRRWAVAQIARLHPDVVVLAYGGLFAGLESDRSIGKAWVSGVESTVRRLRPLAADTKVISDITNLDFPPGDCITRPDSTTSSCMTPEQEVTRLGNSLTRRAVTRLGGEFVDVTGLVCLRRRCPLIVDRIITYRDSAHLTLTWSNLVTDELGRRLRLFTP